MSAATSMRTAAQQFRDSEASEATAHLGPGGQLPIGEPIAAIRLSRWALHPVSNAAVTDQGEASHTREHRALL